MTIFDLKCDRCGIQIVGRATESMEGSAANHGVGFLYHPGEKAFADNSGLACTGCWDEMSSWLGEQSDDEVCSVCGVSVERCLFVQTELTTAWRLCSDHAVEFLNSLRTVEPKLDPESFVLPTSAG